MAYKHISRVPQQSSKYFWSQRTRTPRTVKWNHLQLPVWDHCLQWGVHRGNTKVSEWDIQGTPQTTLSTHMHIQQMGHTSTLNNLNIIGEYQGLARPIKEAIYIRVKNPTLNRNIGKYNLNHILVRVLFNTPWLKIGSLQSHVHIQNNGHAQTNPSSGHPQIYMTLCACSVFRTCAQSPSNINNCSNARLFSDLMKFIVVNESLSKQSRNVLFQWKINWINISCNVMYFW